MSLLSRLFSRTEPTPLLELDALLEARDVPKDLPGLDILRPDFNHLSAEQREHFADALADLHGKKQPLPPPWLDAQYELTLEVIPTWRGEKEGFFHRPVAEGLSQRILVGGSPMPEAWPVLWLVRMDEVLDRAMDHLRELSKNKPFEKQASGIYSSTFGDGFDAARLLLPELWENLCPGQNHFIAVPTENCMLVAPQVLLPKLVEAIQKKTADPSNLLLATILQWVNHNLLPANLQDPHPIAQPQRELRQMDYMAAVAAQDRDLDPAMGNTAGLASIRAQNGKTFTMATWQAGSPVLLPEADLISFHARSKEPLGVYWRHTMPRIPEIKGTLVEIWGPRRIRYDCFPTAEQLAKLECFATAEQWKGILAQSAEKNSATPKQQAPARNTAGNTAGSTGASSSVTSSAPGTSVAAQASSPLPAHLRNAGLGVQDGK